MASTVQLDVKGQKTNVSPLAMGGNLLEARNCIYNRDGHIERRLGWNYYGGILSFPLGAKINKILPFRSRAVVQYYDSLAYDSDGSGTFVDYSVTYSEFDNFKIQSFEANKSLFYTDTTGIKKIATLSGTPEEAGVPKAIDFSIADAGGAYGAPLVNARQYAYRVVWGIKDANEFLILSAPSQRGVHLTTSTNALQLTVYIPDGITTDHFIQVYRSQASAGAAVEPDDELSLSFEGSPTSAEITAGVMVVIDAQPEELLGAALYTSPSQESINNANDLPPIAKTVAYWNSRAWYGNTQRNHNATLTLISENITAGDIVTINFDSTSVNFTAGGVENAATRTFLAASAGTPGENIDATARSLVRVINTGSWPGQEHIYAYYLSGFDGTPGQMFFETRRASYSSFTVTADSANTGEYFRPILNPGTGAGVSSSAEIIENRLYYSKMDQPEAVPILNYFDVGSSDFEIQRIVPLQDSFFIFKQDGVFRLSGDNENNFRLRSFDPTVRIAAKETAVVFQNEIYLFSDQGPVSVSDSGVQILPRDVENLLKKYLSFDNLEDLSFAVADDTEKAYILCLPAAENDISARIAFVYYSIQSKWSVWDMRFDAGLKIGQDVFFASSFTKYIFKQRKNRKNTDYRDETTANTISSFVGTSITFASSAGLKAMSYVYQNGRYSRIQDTTGSIAIVEDSLEWDLAACEISVPIKTKIQLAPQHMGDPGIVKQTYRMDMMFNYVDPQRFTVRNSSNLSAGAESVTLNTSTAIAWGQFDWGQEDWGGGVPSAQVHPIYIPPDSQWGNWQQSIIESQDAFVNFSFIGFAFFWTPMSEVIS